MKPTISEKKTTKSITKTPASRIQTYSVAAPYHVIYKNNPYYATGPHSHNAVELYLNLTDLPDVLLNDTVMHVPANTLLIIPPFMVHQLYPIDTVYERYILSINSQWLESVFCDKGDSLRYLGPSMTPLLVPLNEVENEELISQMKDLLSISNTLSAGAMTCLFSILDTIDNLVAKTTGLETPSHRRMESSPSQISTEQPAPASVESPRPANGPDSQMHASSSQQTVNKIIAYIQEHIHENISVSDVAAHFYLNPDYVSRLFKNHVHVSVGHYIAVQKTSAAQSLLREGFTVAEVQEKLGYSSYAYFFKSFKKNTDFTPSQYRTQYYKGKG